MNKTFKTMGALLFAGSLLLTACDGINLPTDLIGEVGGVEKADVQGKVMKNDSDPGKNATIALIKKVNGKNEEQTVRTDDKGVYKFGNVSFGNYRVAFLLQSEAARKSGDPQYFADNAQAKDFFAFVSSNNFDYKGDKEGVFEIPTFNVGWTSNITPQDGSSVSASGSMDFSWSSAQDAKQYNLEVLDSNGNSFFKSKQLDGTSYTWDKAGVTSGTYFYRVNVVFNESDKNIFPTQAGSALLKLNVN